jgi:adenylate cyclase
MGQEIEYRYLLKSLPPTGAVKPHAIAQGYLSTDPDRIVRVRVKGDQGFLTIKGRKIDAVSPEFEYEIPVDEAQSLLTLCGQNVLTKDRYALVGPDGMIWDVDIFTGRHAGLMIAEIELAIIDDQYMIPSWVDGADITGDSRLGNAALAQIGDDALRALLAEYAA